MSVSAGHARAGDRSQSSSATWCRRPPPTRGPLGPHRALSTARPGRCLCTPAPASSSSSAARLPAQAATRHRRLVAGHLAKHACATPRLRLLPHLAVPCPRGRIRSPESSTASPSYSGRTPVNPDTPAATVFPARSRSDLDPCGYSKT